MAAPGRRSACTKALRLSSAGILTALTLAIPCAAVQPAKPAPWVPSSSLVSTLSPSARYGSFRLRAPKGYVAQKQTARAAGEGFAWTGPERTEGPRAFLLVGIVPVPPKEAVKYTAEKALDRFLAAIEKRRQGWKRSAVERGKINGRAFVRARWSGKDTETGAAMRGFNYVSYDGKTVIQIASQDADPHAAGSLKTTEAAALTFRRP